MKTKVNSISNESDNGDYVNYKSKKSEFLNDNHKLQGIFWLGKLGGFLLEQLMTSTWSRPCMVPTHRTSVPRTIGDLLVH